MMYFNTPFEECVRPYQDWTDERLYQEIDDALVAISSTERLISTGVNIGTIATSKANKTFVKYLVVLLTERDERRKSSED
jgi:hypothetical protein